VLNLVGAEALYGKEAAGDIWEGKWTIMLMHLLSTVSRKERAQIVRILSKPRPAKTEEEVDYVLGLMKKYGSIEHGKATALHYARQAQVIFERRLGILPESPHKDFLRDMIMYVIEREL
jgi:geranylgeranyl diphosphate synthase type II